VLHCILGEVILGNMGNTTTKQCLAKTGETEIWQHNISSPAVAGNRYPTCNKASPLGGGLEGVDILREPNAEPKRRNSATERQTRKTKLNYGNPRAETDS